MSALGGEYDTLTYAGYQKSNLPNSPAALALLDELQGKGFVARLGQERDPIKVNKRLK